MSRSEDDAAADDIIACTAAPYSSAEPREGAKAVRSHVWLSQIDTLSSKQTPDARKTRFSLFGFNLTQARAADDELWCVYDPVFDLLEGFW